MAPTLTVTVPVSVHFGSGDAFVVPSSHTVYVNDANPVNPGSGVYVTVPPARLTDPCVSAPAATAVTVNVCADSLAGPGVSFADNDDTLTSTGRPPGVDTLSAPGTGGSLTSLTTIFTVAGTDVVCPSNTVNVKASLPKKSGAGVYVRSGAVPDNVPCAGAPTEYVIGSPSGSDPDTANETAVSSTASTVAAFATGGWFADCVTVTDTIPSAHRGSGCPFVVPSSHTRYVNDAAPANPGSGVYVTVPSARVTVPWVSALAATAFICRTWLASLAGPGESFARNVAGFISNGAPPETVTLSGRATGGSFTSVTVTVTVAGGDVDCPSNTVNVNRSRPKKSGAGVYETVAVQVRFFELPPS